MECGFPVLREVSPRDCAAAAGAVGNADAENAGLACNNSELPTPWMDELPSRRRRRVDLRRVSIPRRPPWRERRRTMRPAISAPVDPCENHSLLGHVCLGARSPAWSVSYKEPANGVTPRFSAWTGRGERPGGAPIITLKSHASGAALMCAEFEQDGYRRSTSRGPYHLYLSRFP